MNSLRSQMESVQSEKFELSANLKGMQQRLEVTENLHKQVLLTSLVEDPVFTFTTNGFVIFVFQKVENLKEKCNHLSSALEEVKSDAKESRERWLLVNEEKTKVEKQVRKGDVFNNYCKNIN